MERIYIKWGIDMSVLKKNTKKEFGEIEPKEAFIEIEKNKDNPDFVVLDVRTPKEYSEGHIENANLLNVQSEDFENQLEKLDKDKTYVVYCKAGIRGCKAVDLMEKHGYKEVHNITGGIDKWKSKRLPVTE
jgi:rhodanese-related sulfurtransferase